MFLSWMHLSRISGSTVRRTSSVASAGMPPFSRVYPQLAFMQPLFSFFFFVFCFLYFFYLKLFFCTIIANQGWEASIAWLPHSLKARAVYSAASSVYERRLARPPPATVPKSACVQRFSCGSGHTGDIQTKIRRRALHRAQGPTHTLAQHSATYPNRAATAHARKSELSVANVLFWADAMEVPFKTERLPISATPKHE